jgi:hypothetical protein
MAVFHRLLLPPFRPKRERIVIETLVAMSCNRCQVNLLVRWEAIAVDLYISFYLPRDIVYWWVQLQRLGNDTPRQVQFTLLTPDRYGDPNDPLGSALFWLPDPERLLEHQMVGPWLRIAAALSAIEPIEDNQTVQMGSPLGQQPLSHTTP